jgi:hypothetical protein
LRLDNSFLSHDGHTAPGGNDILQHPFVRFVVEYGELIPYFHDGCYLPDVPLRVVQCWLREAELWLGQPSAQFH